MRDLVLTKAGRELGVEMKKNHASLIMYIYFMCFGLRRIGRGIILCWGHNTFAM